MSAKWRLIIGASALLVLLPQASALVFTPWRSDYDHWFAVVCVVVICALPLSFAYRRWHDGPERYQNFIQAVAARGSVSVWKYGLVWVVAAIILTAIFYARQG